MIHPERQNANDPNGMPMPLLDLCGDEWVVSVDHVLQDTLRFRAVLEFGLASDYSGSWVPFSSHYGQTRVWVVTSGSSLLDTDAPPRASVLTEKVLADTCLFSLPLTEVVLATPLWHSLPPERRESMTEGGLVAWVQSLDRSDWSVLKTQD